jgi:hypothetical protein
MSGKTPRPPNAWKPPPALITALAKLLRSLAERPPTKGRAKAKHKKLVMR